MAESNSKLKPIELESHKGLTLTVRSGEGIRVTVGDVAIDVVAIKFNGKQVRLTINTGDTKHRIDRCYIKDWIR